MKMLALGLDPGTVPRYCARHMVPAQLKSAVAPGLHSNLVVSLQLLWLEMAGDKKAQWPCTCASSV